MVESCQGIRSEAWASCSKHTLEQRKKGVQRQQAWGSVLLCTRSPGMCNGDDEKSRTAISAQPFPSP